MLYRCAGCVFIDNRRSGRGSRRQIGYLRQGGEGGGEGRGDKWM